MPGSTAKGPDKEDRRLEAVGLKNGWVYSRYANDLAFSTKDNTRCGAAIALIK